MIDLSHIPLLDTTPNEVWEQCGQYVVHAHMGNCVMEHPGHPMNGDEHPPFCDPAGKNGIEELAEYLKVLLEGGYLSEKNKKPLSFEVCAYGDLSRDEVLRQSKDIIEKAWKRLHHKGG
jgi:sugar phosphate isomerase/epimerase